MYLKEGYNTYMISKQQTPTNSGFHAKTNANEITKGINLDEKIAIGDKIKGKVVVVADYGAFVEVQTGIEA